MFADDCIIAGVAGEVLRTVTHWKRIMPRLGLPFSKLDAIPSAKLLIKPYWHRIAVKFNTAMRSVSCSVPVNLMNKMMQ